jgi:ribose 5-phosphate isomerase B
MMRRNAIGNSLICCCFLHWGCYGAEWLCKPAQNAFLKMSSPVSSPSPSASPAATIALGCDHAAVALKEALKATLLARGLVVHDVGTHDAASVDYPDIAAAVAAAIPGVATRGVLLCGSGIGMAMAANRQPHIRAALCHDHLSARLSRQHNDANVLVLGARLLGEATAQDCLDIFLDTPFEGGRHSRRIAKFCPADGQSAE